MSVSQTALHTRTSSIPAMSSGILQDLSTKDWLAPPKVLSRSATASSEDMSLDSFQAEHPSFYFNVPATISTPPRQRSTTVTQKSFLNQANQLEYDLSVSLQPLSRTEEDVALSDYSDMPRPSRRRRRTVVHMSSDSIFSSALDFSAYSSDDYLTDNSHPSVNTQSSPSRVDTELQKTITALDPAFSPALTAGVLSQPIEPEANIEASASTQSAPSKIISSDYIPSSRHTSSAAISPISFSNADAGANELREMFSSLGLEGALSPSCMRFGDTHVYH